MAQPALKARFFVGLDGIALERAPPLKRSERFRFYAASRQQCSTCNRPVRFGGITASPYERTPSGHVDHVFPRSRGGQNHASNLQLLCISCNTRKGSKA